MRPGGYAYLDAAPARGLPGVRRAAIRRIAALAVLALALPAAACTQGAKSGRKLVLPPPVDESSLPVAVPSKPFPALPSGPQKIAGTPSYRVVWEALAVEKYRLDHPGVRPAGSLDPETARGMGNPDFEVVLLNASYLATPEQDREDKSQPPSGRVARVSDQQMLDLLGAIETAGFWKYAQPTGSVRSLFSSEAARGRVTVEKDGESLTVLSLRGLGLQAETREVPAVYAAVKEAITILKNSAPNMRVVGGGVGTRDAGRYRYANPTDPPAKGAGGSPPAPAPGGGTDAPPK